MVYGINIFDFHYIYNNIIQYKGMTKGVIGAVGDAALVSKVCHVDL